jgi:AraC-like DNA-binding protein
MSFYSKHFLISKADQKLPLYMESIGFIPKQKPFTRENGYPCYHWLQTREGRGHFRFSGETYTLSPGRGILLLPGVAHQYEADSDPWSTYYIAFDGSLAQALLGTMDLHLSSYYDLEQPEELVHFFESTIQKTKSHIISSGLEGSLAVYEFITLLKKYGQVKNHTSLSHTYKRLTHLHQWMEENYNDPKIGLNDMARLLHVSPQHLNTLFRRTYGSSPYSYLIHFRIQKAKEYLINDRSSTVKAVASLVGFHDTSHFISTFLRIAGMTPDTYKKLY